MPPRQRPLSASAARQVLAEISRISREERAENFTMNNNAMARLVLWRLIRILDARLPPDEQRGVQAPADTLLG